MNDPKSGPHASKSKIVYVLEGDPTLMLTTKMHTPGLGKTGKRNKVCDKITISSQHDETITYKSPLKMHISFYFSIPHHPHTKRPNMKRGSYHIHYPDLINCTKYVEDICKDVLFKDNFFIASVEATKFYDEHARTEFYLTELV